MRKFNKTKGFSLIEILLALGVLTMGMLFVAGSFSVGLHFSKVSTERTIGATVADEAFAKIKLFGIRDSNSIDLDRLLPNGELFELAFDPALTAWISEQEFSYPSLETSGLDNNQYYWSAVCRLLDRQTRLVQVTVFVCRKTSANLEYPIEGSTYVSQRPMAMRVPVNWQGTTDTDRLLIQTTDDKKYFDDGSTILDGRTGEIYRILERNKLQDRQLILDRRVQPIAPLSYVWVIPRAVNGGNDPCIGIYQKVMRF